MTINHIEPAGDRRHLVAVLAEVADERDRQDHRWGQQNHPDGTGPRVPVAGRLCFAQDAATEARHACERAAAEGSVTWEKVLREEFCEAVAEDDPARLRTELVQVAAVAIAWVQAIDRRRGVGPAAPVVQRGRWYPEPAPALDDETDEQYTDRLLGHYGPALMPYDHTRNRQCSLCLIGYHDECSDPAGQFCGCPCHHDPAGR